MNNLNHSKIRRKYIYRYKNIDLFIDYHIKTFDVFTE